MQRFCTLGFVLGLILMVFGLTYALPIATSLYFDDGMADHFVRGMSLNIGLGSVLAGLTMRFRGDIKTRDGYLLVASFWILMSAAATLPLLWGIPGLSFTDAFFETVSGFTTTGATILIGLDALAPSLNLWRHEMVWIGGLGIIVLAVAILPLLGIGGMQLYKAEIAGPIKDSKITPRITETARLLWLVYAGITLACIASLKMAGMSWFDAICHAFSAMGLGGFSTHDASVGYYDSPAIELVLIVFMLISAMNFALHYQAVHLGSLMPYKQDAEVLPMLALVAFSIWLCSWYIWDNGVYSTFLESLRHVAFNLVSIATDCGFASVDYDKWPPFVPWWMLYLSCITCCTGSTGGGIKMFRTLLLWKQASREMFSILHPRAINPIRIGDMPIPNKIIFAVLAFIFMYFISVVVLTFSLIFSGLDAISALSAILACINNAGPGLNQVGPATNYQSLGDFQTWICSAAMLLGRLEIITLIVLFTPTFWRK
ncbi:TrkH family potassium uptake protein [Methylomonas sp. MED-D]|uniref:Trk system potassium uptake protein n=1 Tax=Methylomonas koyamae TaxID=702114 RepID=A0A177N1N5_9GAMM|nr:MULTISPECIES: potassium transporter TrkG [Methylomonas]MDT4330116.1 potassium transporter TrkG [Methylomonas sp. MV1]OAI11878.1 potassium transporter Trk [Methylomonas koyamae]OHX37610.1 potassium transporter Trk [Methylomonas sp. LWB]WGS86753.1 potassium transporter TrkG [Methylomonas sp. UP202]